MNTLRSSSVLVDVGQIELYSHIPVLRAFVDQLKVWDFRVCAVYMLDSQVCCVFRCGSRA